MPESVSAFLNSPIIADIVLAVLIGETLAVALFLKGRRPRLARSVALNGLSGAFILVALRVLWNGGDGVFVAVFLAASFVAHLTDLAMRLRE
ncbi:hypothetical protein GGD81_002378 [Rhodobium orientis]|uniref:DUF2568 domain-containing protein n=1 Tax=Rhodobium orientis TaxID=34017 RepID=A0A327JHC4_9HYPH|nr:hypothetical protein [Rhodobium orientis]MBB4303335.1 hypothetical protein [Rhodobium orientis]MBK5951570.1 hypothetical protein [Rhodobium orientis]RAI24714.1 hypothetical protein CH339_21575 [Rhodobium orientis]